MGWGGVTMGWDISPDDQVLDIYYVVNTCSTNLEDVDDAT